ncbi:MAG: Hsp20/alpha crystallin family protein [Deltaproteobacteria bacterium]|nr:Hsp20/alpha crystallin family protein [Deltaproteobacteria bacterium]
MSQLILWKDRELSKFKRDMDRLFERCRPQMGVGPLLEKLAEAIDIKTLITNDAFIVRAVMDDIDQESLNVTVARDTLTIQGGLKENVKETSGPYRIIEKKHTTFTRRIALPFRVELDKVKGTYKNGILTIVAPKRKPETTRQVRIEMR